MFNDAIAGPRRRVKVLLGCNAREFLFEILLDVFVGSIYTCEVDIECRGLELIDGFFNMHFRPAGDDSDEEAQRKLYIADGFSYYAEKPPLEFVIGTFVDTVDNNDPR